MIIKLVLLVQLHKRGRIPSRVMEIKL